MKSWIWLVSWGWGAKPPYNKVAVLLCEIWGFAVCLTLTLSCMSYISYLCTYIIDAINIYSCMFLTQYLAIIAKPSKICQQIFWGVMCICSLWYYISHLAVLIQNNQQVSVCFSQKNPQDKPKNKNEENLLSFCIYKLLKGKGNLMKDVSSVAGRNTHIVQIVAEYDFFLCTLVTV